MDDVKQPKRRKYVQVSAYWGNDDVESTIRMSRRTWRMINEGEDFYKSTWSYYEGKRYSVSWSFSDKKVSISGMDGMECWSDSPLDSLIIHEIEV
jgi:hypothetical protein